MVQAQENYQHWGDQAPAGWQNGALQGSNSDYFEGEVVPHYFTSNSLVAGQTYAINIYYDYVDAAKNGCGFTRAHPVQRQSHAKPDRRCAHSGRGRSDVLGHWSECHQRHRSARHGHSAIHDRYLHAHERRYGRGAVLGSPPGQAGGYRGLHRRAGVAGASLQTNVGATPTVVGATMLGGGGTMAINPSGIVRGTIGGFKFSDLDGDGTQDAGKPGLTNWTINLCSDSACATVLQTTTTAGSDGAYSFSVTPGTYYVREVQQSGWSQTAPSGGFFGPISITAADPTETGLRFGNRQLGSLVLAKSLTGGPGGYTDPFRIDYDCTGTAFDGFRNVAAGASSTVSGIPVGTTCTVTETTFPTPPSGYSFGAVTYSDNSGTTNNDGIVANSPGGSSVTVTVNNVLNLIPAPALTLDKTITAGDPTTAWATS